MVRVIWGAGVQGERGTAKVLRSPYSHGRSQGQHRLTAFNITADRSHLTCAGDVIDRA